MTATGSARIPALHNGVFGFRPTMHSISAEGLIKAWPAMDTPALLGRDVSVFPRVLKVLQSQQPNEPASKDSSDTVFYPQAFILEDCPEQVEAMESFIDDMCNFGGFRQEKFSIRDDWQKTAPVEEKNLQQYLYNVSTG